MTKFEIADRINAVAATLRDVHDAPPVVLHQAHELEGLAAWVVLLTESIMPSESLKEIDTLLAESQSPEPVLDTEKTV